MAGTQHMTNDRPGWADKPENNSDPRVLYGACVVLVIADFMVHRHISTPTSNEYRPSMRCTVLRRSSVS